MHVHQVYGHLALDSQLLWRCIGICRHLIGACLHWTMHHSLQAIDRGLSALDDVISALTSKTLQVDSLTP